MTTQTEVNVARDHLYNEGERLMALRDLEKFESSKYWELHDAAWRLFGTAEALLKHKPRRHPLELTIPTRDDVRAELGLREID